MTNWKGTNWDTLYYKCMVTENNIYGLNAFFFIKFRLEQSFSDTRRTKYRQIYTEAQLCFTCFRFLKELPGNFVALKESVNACFSIFHPRAENFLWGRLSKKKKPFQISFAKICC